MGGLSPRYWHLLTRIVCRWGRFSGRYPWVLEELFKKYGNVVRIAPNELVFCGPEAYYGL